MNALRYICLSDLHLGAPESLFTQVDDQGLPDHAACSDALKTFGALLREYVASMTGDGPPPQLILLGDVLDMGLSPVGDTAAAYERFIEVLFPPGPGAVFSRHVLCVPGNHDHLLWSMAKQDHFQQQLKRHYGELPEDDACDRGLPQFMPVTPLFAVCSRRIRRPPRASWWPTTDLSRGVRMPQQRRTVQSFSKPSRGWPISPWASTPRRNRSGARSTTSTTSGSTARTHTTGKKEKRAKTTRMSRVLGAIRLCSSLE